MKIRIYGSGCDKCKKLAANVEAAAKNMGMEVELEKVTDINAITDAGILMTPALAIDGKVVGSGKVFSREELENLLKPPACSCGGICPPVMEASDAETLPCGCCGGGKRGKKYLTAFLLLFVFLSLAFVFVREAAGNAEAKKTAAAAGSVQNNVLTVYYFHGNMRCNTCNRFENLTREIVRTHFAEQLANGDLVLKIVNIDEPANEHFVQDFQLTTKSVVLQKNGQYKNLDQIWTLIRQSDSDFKAYVKNGIEGMLEAK